MIEETNPERARLGPGTAVGGLLLVALLWGFVQFVDLGRAPFHTKGEPREAIVVQGILRTGEWILPRRNAIELPAKPPLFHWLGAAASRVLGRVDEASARCPSAILSGLSALLIYVAGASLWGPFAGLVAAIGALTSFEWERAATSARVDMTLTFGLTLACVGLLMFRSRGRPAWLLAFYGGMAWATLAKGPVGFVLPLAVVAALCLVELGTGPLRGLRLVPGMLFVLLCSGCWYILAIVDGGREFFDKQIVQENLLRVAGTAKFRGGHRHSVAYLFFALLGGLLPWTLFLPSLVGALRTRAGSLSRRDPVVLLLLWVAIVFAVYAAATSKRSVYLLGLYPALFLLLGWWWDLAARGLVRCAAVRYGLPALAGAVATIAALLAMAVAADALGLGALDLLAPYVHGMAAADLRGLVLTARSATLPLLGCLVATVAAAGLLALAAWQGRVRLAFAALALTLATVLFDARHFVLPAVAANRSRQPFVARVREIVGDSDAFASYRHFDYGFVFYWGRPVPVWTWRSGEPLPEYVVMSEDDWQTLPADRRAAYEPTPGLKSTKQGNMGRLLLLRRVVPPPPAAPAELPAEDDVAL